MESKEEGNVFGLITELSKHIFEKQSKLYGDGTPYSQTTNDAKLTKFLRSRAFEILLNMTGKECLRDDCRRQEDYDPIVEILKYAFIIMPDAKYSSKATKLQELLEQLDVYVYAEPLIVSILQFLVHLRSLPTEAKHTSNMLYYNESQPSITAMLDSKQNVPMFNICPIESFILRDQFEFMLDNDACTNVDSIHIDAKNKLPFYRNDINNTVNIESVSFSTFPENDYISNSGKQPCILTPLSDYSVKDVTTVSYLPFHISAYDNSRQLYSKEYQTAHYSAFSYTEEIPVDNHIISNVLSSMHNRSIENFFCFKQNLNSIWHDLNIITAPLSNIYTWELLGNTEYSKEALFMTEKENVAIHLTRMKQARILHLLPSKTIMDMVCLLNEVSIKEFLIDIKLLLLGIESNSFQYDDIMGFSLRRYISINGMNPWALEIACQDLISWGNSYKNLLCLIARDPQTGKLQREGLIFKAMCNSIKELLVYYQALLLLIFDQDVSGGLLKILGKVRPITHLITEVVRLCRCKEQGQCALGENSGLLTLIYKEITNIADTKIAVVFYSILKSCCEVYFRSLQKWLFEGCFEDVYGEFMIKAKPQYLCIRGHTFWTKSFAIRTESVPGFLSVLTESILQCGKTLRLLRTCDPKNPVCDISISKQPELKVCLNVAMLHEQLERCKVYECKAEDALGTVVSLSTAIEDQKRITKEVAALVFPVQQDMLTRINTEHQAYLNKMAQSKLDVLEGLKAQIVEVHVEKENVKGIAQEEEKLCLAKIAQEDKEKFVSDAIKRTQIINYYDQLSAEAEKRCAHSLWRKKRMSLFEKRNAVLLEGKDEPSVQSNKITADIQESVCTVQSKEVVENKIESVMQLDNTIINGRCRETVLQSSQNSFLCEDENKNFPLGEAIPVETIHDNSINRPDVQYKSCMNNMNIHEKATLNDRYINRQNNERSTLQETLSNNQDLTELNSRMMKTVLKKSTNNLVGENPVTYYAETMDNQENLVNKQVVARPKHLSFVRTNIEAETNRLNVLIQEYGMTPNNNEIKISFMHEENNANIEKDKDENTARRGSKVTDIEKYTKEVANNANIININANIPECTKTESTSVLCQDGNLETPMSCTTDNFTLSTQSPISQMHNSQHVSPLSESNELLTSNHSVKSISAINFELPWRNFAHSESSEFGFDVMKSETKSEELTLADIAKLDNTSLQIYLERSIRIPLQIQCRLVNNAIIKYFLTEHKLLSHLHSLRSYFFLLNGEFAKSLTVSLYSHLYDISMPNELFNAATLTHLLERALVNSINGTYINAELLSLSAVDTPVQLHISDPSALDCLCLNYKITWPLNIIFDDMSMLQYSKVFKFLLMSGRVSWVLQEDFNIMKVKRNTMMSHQYHKLQLYRHAMTQFMHALHNYLMCSVLHASWAEFEKDLQNSLTLDQIYSSHVNYIKRILSRCMLNNRGEKMRVCLNNVFKVILKFHNRLRSRAWIRSETGYEHPNFEKLEHMYQSFCELRTYMAHVAFKLATSGYQPHLTHFLNALNINHMYNLNVKTNQIVSSKDVPVRRV
ncbi:hypothetical protein KM043_011255 [Ampulex compressa]|nr:hypothetical protein KM043_011255 [Ampulex compressa]